MNYFIEVDYSQFFKEGQSIGGDVFLLSRNKEEGQIICTLSDGLGSGVKANVLANLTAHMAQKYALSTIDIVKSAEIIMNTLPVCRERKISYSTFSILKILYKNSNSLRVSIVEYDNPGFLLLRGGEYIDCEKTLHELKRPGAFKDEILFYTEMNLYAGDRILLYTDGVTQAGLGTKSYPLGWREDKVREFVRNELVRKPHLSAYELASAVTTKAKAVESNSVSLPPLTVIKAACSACKKGQYSITEFCKGCLARPCQTSCPVEAVSLKNNRAHINPEKCLNCGKCKMACPYSAIVYTPVPCEEVCPVKAIDHNDGSSISINETKCISCGKCARSCPFGAIVERSHILPVAGHLKRGENVTLLLAPSILSQFPGGQSRIIQAFKALGFTNVYSLKESAEVVAREESEELHQRLAEGASFMTTSCCPAYVETVKKHLPQLTGFLSCSVSPMIVGGQIVKSRNPVTKTVFAGPCLAKKVEAFDSESVDYVLTFEELGTMLISRGIEINDFISEETENDFVFGQGFAKSGGVAKAVDHYSFLPMSSMCVDGITTKSINLLRSYEKRPPGKNLLEVMACEGGCVKGPCSLN